MRRKSRTICMPEAESVINNLEQRDNQQTGSVPLSRNL